MFAAYCLADRLTEELGHSPEGIESLDLFQRDSWLGIRASGAGRRAVGFRVQGMERE